MEGVGGAGQHGFAAATPRIRAIEEQLRSDTDAGLSHGLLRYPAVGGSHVPDNGAEVKFNYLGRFCTPSGTAWSSAPEFDAARVGYPANARVGHALVVDVVAIDQHMTLGVSMF